MTWSESELDVGAEQLLATPQRAPSCRESVQESRSEEGDDEKEEAALALQLLEEEEEEEHLVPAALRPFLSARSRLKLCGLRQLQLSRLPCESLHFPLLAEHLAWLKSLTLSQNDLASLDLTNDVELSFRHSLRHLDVTDNRLAFLPNWTEALTRLQTLRVGRNLSLDLPSSVTARFGRQTCRSLTTLDLSSTGHLRHFPRALSRLRDLRALDLSRNVGMHSLPAEIDVWQGLAGLRRLSLARLDLAHLPDEMAELGQLRTLDLSHNHLFTLPDVLMQIPKLQFLDLSHNRLSYLPDDMTSMANLRQLLLAHNVLANLPRFPMPNLAVLDCYDNQLDEYTQDLWLHDLDALDLGKNDGLCRVYVDDLIGFDDDGVYKYGRMERRLRSCTHVTDAADREDLIESLYKGGEGDCLVSDGDGGGDDENDENGDGFNVPDPILGDGQTDPFYQEDSAVMWEDELERQAWSSSWSNAEDPEDGEGGERAEDKEDDDDWVSENPPNSCDCRACRSFPRLVSSSEPNSRPDEYVYAFCKPSNLTSVSTSKDGGETCRQQQQLYEDADEDGLVID